MMRNRLSDACRRAPSLAAAIGSLLLVSLSSAPPAFALLKGISIAPPGPGTCDSVSITVAGELPACSYIVGATIRAEQLPCARPTPCPRFLVEITVRKPVPVVCTAVGERYTRSFDVSRLAAGEYTVLARERVVSFSADSTDTTVTESFASAAFTVRPDFACPPGENCYILSFTTSPPRPFPIPPCTATGPPGGTACLSLNLMNTNAVAGLQTTIEVTNADGTPADPFIHAVSVDPIMRALGFQVGWTAEGSRTRILLYSTTPGASIPPDAGPVIRICYSIARETQPQVFRVFDSATIVADPVGEAIPPCPTLFAPIAPGTICVGSPGCDVNGDGVADVLDIIRLVRCALASSSDSLPACPDSIAARADCNADGSVDIRDVICCVRKIVQLPSGLLIGTAEPAVGQGNAVGFESGIRWSDALEGSAFVRIDAGEDWGGAQFTIDPRGAPVRIRGLKLAGSSSTDQMEWAVDPHGVAHGMLYAVSPGARASRSYRVEVLLERSSLGPASGVLQLDDVMVGTRSGAMAQATVFNAGLLIAGAPVGAPMLLSARPNPSSGKTEIGFALPADARVTLHVYDVAGRLVRTLIDGPVPAGVHREGWDGKDRNGRVAVSGLYFVKLRVGATVRSERILLLR